MCGRAASLAMKHSASPAALRIHPVATTVTLIASGLVFAATMLLLGAG